MVHWIVIRISVCLSVPAQITEQDKSEALVSVFTIHIVPRVLNFLPLSEGALPLVTSLQLLVSIQAQIFRESLLCC